MALLDITNVSRMLELYLGYKSCLTLCVFDTHSPHIPRNRDPAFAEQSTTVRSSPAVLQKKTAIEIAVRNNITLCIGIWNTSKV